MNRQLSVRLSIGFVVFLGIAIIVGLPLLIKGWIATHEEDVWVFLSQLVEQKTIGSPYALVVLTFAAAAVSGLLPLSLLAIVAGSFFGFVAEVLLAAVGGMAIGALLSFMLARHGLRRQLERWVSKRISIDRLDREITARGWRFVLLIRLSPVAPFSFISYAFGLTQVRLLDFLFGTAGSLPGLTAYVYSGALSKNLFSILNGQVEGPEWLHLSLLTAGLLATILAVVMASRIVKNVFGIPSWESEPETVEWSQVSRFKDGLSKAFLMVKADDHCFAFKRPALPAWMQPLCDSAWEKGITRRHLILGAMAAVWFATVLATIWHHEFWRDEVRALSIAIAPPSLWELPEFLKNEGHPVVWYILLRIGHQVIGSPLALPVVSVLVAGAAVIIFLFCSPFSLGLKFLFVFSVLPLYEYSVMARNYGISMLLMFGFAAVYPHRRQYLFLIMIILALLANTNVHSLLIAAILTVLWLWDEVVIDRRSLSARQLSLLGLAAGLILASVLFAVRTTLPDETTIVTNVYHATSLKDYLVLFAQTLRKPWQTMSLLIPFPDWFLGGQPWRLLQILLVGALILGLAVRVRFALALLAALLALGYLFNFVYGGSLRHQGLVLIFTLVLYWLNAEVSPNFRNPLLAQCHTLALVIVLPLVLLWGDSIAFRQVQRDFKFELSSCKALEQWFSRHPEFQDAIILGEPDYLLEALPYYAAQRIYIPRESRYGNWVRFTTESRPVMSLGELLDTAQELKEKEQQKILVALGFPASYFEQNSSKVYSYNKVLTWTPSEWQRFRQGTELIAEFWSSKRDENFALYVIR